MKKFFIILCLGLSFAATAQQSFIPVKGEQVKVRDWGSRSIMVLKGFFDETMDSIIARIGQAEFDVMKDRCSAAGWPEGLYFSDLSEEEDKAFDISLNGLKMYKIAGYTHIFNKKIFDRYVILRVPYEENKDWNKTVTWEGNIYFLLKEKDIESL